MDFSFLKNAINIWYVPIERNPILFKYCQKALTDSELQRATSFKFEKVKNNYIYSQGVLRLLLSKYLKIPPREIQIGRHKKGKPYSIDNPDLKFNMSNSGMLVIYSFSYEEELGIDIEKIRPLNDIEDLINKNFTTLEKGYINKVEEKKQQRFFKFWTIKEAYLKAIGEGMRLPPDNFEFSIENGEFKLQTVMGVQENNEWIFKDLCYSDDYKGTLTYKNVNANILEYTII